MIPVKYRKSAEALATYNFTDVASGLGYETFYLFTSYDGAKAYNLSSVAAYGNDDSVTNGSYNFVTSAFNLPRTLKGNVIADIYGANGGGSFTCSGSLILVSGATETTLGSFVTETYTPTTATVKTSKFTVAETRIKRGDYLKLTLTVNGGNVVYLDASGKRSLAAPSKIHLPFKVVT